MSEVMNSAPIYFQFHEVGAARMALDTLSELGYHVHLMQSGDKPTVSVVVESIDLTSALEVAQAHGGSVMERPPFEAAGAVFDTAYGLDTVPIPAHVVNEDWVDGYADREAYRGASVDWEAEDGEGFDPSEDSYDHFTPGARG
jgi:hypothetical protein